MRGRNWFWKIDETKMAFSFSAKSKTLRCDVHQGEAGLLLLMDIAPVSAKPYYYRSISVEACVSLCFSPTHNQSAQPNIGNMLFRLIKYIPGIRIVWNFYINQFTEDTTQPQNELPSSSSHDRLAWSKKKAQQHMTTSEVKHVFFFKNSCYLHLYIL